MALNIEIKNGNKEIKVFSLKWDSTNGEYIPFGNGHTMTIMEEVQRLFEDVWGGTMDSVGFPLDITLMDFCNSMREKILYTVDMYYRAGRYQSPMDMALVANSANDLIWKYFQMNKYYEEDNKTKIVY